MRLGAVLCLAFSGLILAACYADPYQNPGDWSATGASRENVAQQAADKADLLHGKGEVYSNGVAASAAVGKALGGPAGSATGLQVPPPSISSAGS